MRRGMAMFLGVVVMLATGACVPKVETPKGYYGATEPLNVVIAQINRNNSQIPTLYARHYLEANIYDAKKDKTHFINASGDLFVRKPTELYLRARKDPVSVFELGSTKDRYWLTVFVDGGQHWWGWHKNADKDCAKGMPVRPDLLGEVLGIGDANRDLLELPAPTMRFNNDADVYMLVWHNALEDHWYAQKEIWYDRVTKQPRKVLLFDHNGRIVLRANLQQHVQVEVKDKPKEQWPWIASDYALYFPETKSTMSIHLSDVALTTKNGNPKEGMIRFPEDPDVPPQNQIQIDKACE